MPCVSDTLAGEITSPPCADAPAGRLYLRRQAQSAMGGAAHIERDCQAHE